jgi:hypothetical protein
MPTTFKITTQQAVDLVTPFVTEAPLRDIAAGISLGGTIHKLSVFGAPTIVSYLANNKVRFADPPKWFNGIMAWFCWNDADPVTYPPFFLAFEQHDSYRRDARTEHTDMEYLMRPKSTFTFPGGNVRDFLTNHQIDVSEYDDAEITREEVWKLSANFFAKFPRNPINGEHFNPYPYGFFENKSLQDFKAFYMQPNVKFIRYYFGYDKSADCEKSNRIRLVLVAVDKDGKNLFNDNGGVWMLQHSWPPPPYVV